MNHPLSYVLSLLLLGLGLPLAVRPAASPPLWRNTVRTGREPLRQRPLWRPPLFRQRRRCRAGRYGAAVCGVGRCVMERDGNVMCSTEPRGSAALDRYSQAVCTGGCEPAQASRCKPLTK